MVNKDNYTYTNVTIIINSKITLNDMKTFGSYMNNKYLSNFFPHLHLLKILVDLYRAHSCTTILIWFIWLIDIMEVMNLHYDQPNAHNL
jgi:hypothetical protein